jgi:hypothetical protein
MRPICFSIVLLLIQATFALAQTYQTFRYKLSTITPGTENVQLVYNGDFEFEGPTVNAEHPYPVGGAGRAICLPDPARIMIAINSGVVARAHVEANAD